MSVKRKIKVNKVTYLLPITIICFLVLLIILLFGKSNSNPIVGKWTTEKGTIYQFDKDYTGKLILSIGEYEYKYEIKDDKVIIDFISEKSNDTEFKFKFEGEKLILENSNGVFTFTKVE